MKNLKKTVGFALVAVLSLSNVMTRSQAAVDWFKGAAEDSGTWIKENPGKAAGIFTGALAAGGAAYGGKRYMQRRSNARLTEELKPSDSSASTSDQSPVLKEEAKLVLPGHDNIFDPQAKTRSEIQRLERYTEALGELKDKPLIQALESQGEELGAAADVFFKP